MSGRRRRASWSRRGLVLVALVCPGRVTAARAGTLHVVVDSPVADQAYTPYMARVEDASGTLVAMIRAGESADVEAGSYRVTLLVDPPLERRAVAVPARGERLVRFHELGAIALRVDGADGEVTTAADVYVPDGRRIGAVGSGATLTLPAGRYRLVVRTRPNRTIEGVVVRAGQVNRIEVGIGSGLRVEATGPGGVAVPVRARTLHPDGAVLLIEPGERLSLPPGRYDVRLDTVPPVDRAVTLEAGREQVIRIADLGVLRLDLRDADDRLVAAEATVLDPKSGLELASAANGESVVVIAGAYRVRFRTRPPVTVGPVKVGPAGMVKVGRAGKVAR